MLQVYKYLDNNDNVMRFKNDEEFFNFCVNPTLVINECGAPCIEGTYYQTFNFTKDYNDAVNNGKQFMICDENSQIYKRGAVSYKTITKKVNNLVPYYEI